MARISFTADKAAESTGDQGGSRTTKVRGIYTLQITDHSEGEVTGPQAKNPGVPRTNFTLEIASDDERGQLGEKVFHNVTWIPRGKGEKPAGGHGMAVHWLHACNMPYDGQFDFDEADFLQEGHAMVRALLEVEDYESKNKKPDGTPYVNEKYVIRQVYTEAHPEPAELPPAPAKKEIKRTGAARAAAPAQQDLEEVPF